MVATVIVMLVLVTTCMGQSKIGEASSWQTSRARAEQFIREGRLREALSVLVVLREQFDKAGLSDASLAVILNDLGSVYYALGNHSDAEKNYVQAIRILDDGQMTQEPLMSRLLDNLASLYMDTGRAHAQAERLRRRALALRIGEVGPDGPGVATLLSNLATACMAQGRYEEADTLFQRALAVLMKTPGDNNVDLAGVLQNIAVLSWKMRRYPEAELSTSRAVAILEKYRGVDHPELIMPLLNLARLQVVMSRPVSAEPLLSRALLIAEAKLGPDHPVIADIMLTWADVFQRTRRKAAAEQARRRASAITELHPRSSAARHSVHVSELMRNRASNRK